MGAIGKMNAFVKKSICNFETKNCFAKSQVHLSERAFAILTQKLFWRAGSTALVTHHMTHMKCDIIFGEDFDQLFRIRNNIKEVKKEVQKKVLCFSFFKTVVD